MQANPIVSQEDWLVSRKTLLDKEKQLTRLRDELSAERRRLPWTRVTKSYVFDGPDGQQSLADLFGGRSQLVVKHFMFGPEWSEGCVGCSFHADHMDGANRHLGQRDVTLLAVSRAPLPRIEAFRQRMGWHFKWISSHDSDFNYDFHVSFSAAQLAGGRIDYNYALHEIDSDDLSGISVFYKNASGEIFHTYSAYARGTEDLIGTYSYLDLVPAGRAENGPNHNLMDWVRHHDRYADGRGVTCHVDPPASADGPCHGGG